MRSFSLAVLALVSASSAMAADTPEARLREALHRTTEELRDTQDQLAKLQAKDAENQRQIQALTAQAAEQKAQATAQASAGQREGEQARRAAEAAEREMKQHMAEAQGIVDKWQAAYNQAAAMAKARDEAAAHFQALNKQLTDRTALCEEKNAHLVEIGNEILDRFTDRGFLESFSQTEPFTQIKRVELENIAQDYDDRVHAEKLPPSQQQPILRN